MTMDVMSKEPLCVDESLMKVVRVLGQGSYGSVSLEMHPGYGFYAKKTSPMHLKKTLENELRMMNRFCNHLHIVQAASPHLHFEMFPEDCSIYMRYASEGTLRNIISGFREKSLPEYMIQRAVRMILEGIEALHAKGYVHCDIKPSNILVFPSTTLGEPWELKLADFGLSKEPKSESDPTFPSSMLLGTTQYMPPDAFGPNKVVIDPAFDIYSLGCVVYEMFGGKPIQERFDDYYEWNLFEKISPVARDFLSRCHALHPLLKTEQLDCPVRATTAELLNHPFTTPSVYYAKQARAFLKANKALALGHNNLSIFKRPHLKKLFE